MAGWKRRNPKDYAGTHRTSHFLAQIAPTVVETLRKGVQDNPDTVLLAWPEVVGPVHAQMARAEQFSDGTLVVKVKNSTLYSLLCQDKRRILDRMRCKAPSVEIRNIIFRMT